MTICSNCKTENDGDNAFCIVCGLKLDGGKTVTDTAAEESARSAPAASIRYSPPPSADREALRLSSPSPAVPRPTINYGGSDRLETFGARLDGWADLVEGAGDKAEAVKAAFGQDLKQKGMPNINLKNSEVQVRNRTRSYTLSQTYQGVTVGTYIGPFGRDLYVSWDAFIRPVVKWKQIGIMAGIAAFFALCPSSMGIAFIDSWFGLFFFWIVMTIFSLIPILVGAYFVGRVFFGNPMYFFFEEIDHFSADDTSAMMLANHKALLAAIDQVGLDSSLLRKKETFRGGQRERII